MLGENARKDEGRDWGDVPTSPEIPELAAKHQELGEAWMDQSPSEPPEPTCDTLVADF